MDEKKAREILVDDIMGDNSLGNGYRYLSWVVGEDEVTLDAEFSADELEAIAWWMRNMKAPKEG